jgi:hypothetical protein
VSNYFVTYEVKPTLKRCQRDLKTHGPQFTETPLTFHYIWVELKLWSRSQCPRGSDAGIAGSILVRSCLLTEPSRVEFILSRMQGWAVKWKRLGRKLPLLNLKGFPEKANHAKCNQGSRCLWLNSNTKPSEYEAKIVIAWEKSLPVRSRKYWMFQKSVNRLNTVQWNTLLGKEVFSYPNH